MNTEWMRERLESFQSLCEQYDRNRRPKSGSYPAPDHHLLDKLTTEMPTIREILRRLDPDLVDEIKQAQYTGGMSASTRAVQQALGIIRDREEWVLNLSPDAPSLIADEFHPHAWKAASALWDTGQYRVAVQQSTVSLSAHIASKAGSSLSERKLVNQVLSSSLPGVGQVRLHFPGDTSSDTWRSRQDGLHLLAQGAFAGIRNIAAHTNDEWSEQVALEHLAVLSVIARWVDETVVVTGS